jgi:hypothetical protein
MDRMRHSENEGEGEGFHRGIVEQANIAANRTAMPQMPPKAIRLYVRA